MVAAILRGCLTRDVEKCHQYQTDVYTRHCLSPTYGDPFASDCHQKPASMAGLASAAARSRAKNFFRHEGLRRPLALDAPHPCNCRATSPLVPVLCLSFSRLRRTLQYYSRGHNRQKVLRNINEAS